MGLGNEITMIEMMINKIIEGAPSMAHSDSAGQDTSYNNALTLRHGEPGLGACVPWVAGRIYFGAGAGQPHPFTGSGAPPRGQALRSGSEVS